MGSTIDNSQQEKVMRVKVTEQGVLIPKRLLEGSSEVEIHKHHKMILVLPAENQDPIFQLGMEPVQDDIDDASINHDRYLYTK